MCACVSTNPGTIVAPLTSITSAPSGADPLGPTLDMRLFSITTSAFSITSLPRIVMTRAPRSTTVPCGMSRVASIVTRISSGRYAASRIAAESAPALRKLSSTASASSRRYVTNALPIDQCTVRPSAPQTGNSPPMSVSLRTGIWALSGLVTKTVGTGPPVLGTVIT